MLSKQSRFATFFYYVEICSMEQKIINRIREIFKNRFLKELVITGKQYVGGGCISSTLKLDTDQGEFFLKWNSNCPDDLFIREAECLRELASANQSELIIPKVVLEKETDDLPGFLLLEYLPSGHSSMEDKKLGVGLAKLHRKTNDFFGFHHNNYCGSTLQNNSWNKSWIDFFGQMRILYLVGEISRIRGLSVNEKETYYKLVDRLPVLIDDQSKASLIHGDLWSGNYLYTAKGPALIDPASYYADREMELSIMTMFGGFSRTTWDAYQHEYPLNPGWEDRIQLYQIYHILNHYYLFGGGYGSQALRIAKRFL